MPNESNATIQAPKRRGRRSSLEPSGREALLNAALKQFAQKGFEGASLRNLAADAGVDMALIARIFGNKAKLWESVVEQLAHQMQIETEHVKQLSMLANQSPRTALLELIDAFSLISQAMPEFVVFYVQESVTPGERLDLIYHRLINPFLQICDPIVQAAIKNGAVAASDSRLFLQSLFASISIPILTLQAECRTEVELHERTTRLVQQVKKIYVLSECKQVQIADKTYAVDGSS